jgi:uncharacterized delta-60 repeat protein
MNAFHLSLTLTALLSLAACNTNVSNNSSGAPTTPVDQITDQPNLIAQAVPGPGSFDASFGANGNAFTRASEELVSQTNGRLVMIGTRYISNVKSTCLVQRALENGAFDPSFGASGTVEVAFGTNIAAVCSELALQPDGKIVFAGSQFGDTLGTYGWFVGRLNSNGQPDTGFGMNGLVTGLLPLPNKGFIQDLALQPDGNLLIAGGMREALTYQYRGVIGRLTSSGTLDPSWDGDGWAELTGKGEMSINAIAIQPPTNGVEKVSVVATGTATGTVTPNDAFVVRYTSDGSLDSSFNGGQVFRRSGASASALVVLPVNLPKQAAKILVGGSFGGDFWLTQLLPDGQVDPGFGGLNFQLPGEVKLDFGGNDFLRGIAVQPDGKFVTIGTSDNRLVLNRHRINGALDGNFSSGVKVSSTQNVITKSVVIQVIPGSVVPPQPARARIVGAAKFFNTGDVLLGFLP